MQITLNQDEVKRCVHNYIDNNVGFTGDLEIVINDDGTVTVGINEKVGTDLVEDTPPVVEKKTRKRREAKHVMVEKKEEEPVSEPEAQGEDEVDPNSEIREEAVAQAVKEAAEVATNEATVAEEVQEKEVERPVSSKPSLFSNLKR